MASQMTITVLCPNARRQIVKISPNASVLEVLEEACRKQKLNPDDYDIKHYAKSLDLSLSVRFANLPNNAQLELCPTKRVRQEGSITIALHLESGERPTGDFPSTSTLWEVINTFTNISDSSVAGTEPVCIYMRQKFVGDEIKNTTLRNLGLTGGKASMRLIYRPLESLEEQAHVATPLSRPPPVLKEQFAQKKAASTQLDDDHIIKKQPKLEPQVAPIFLNNNPVENTTPISMDTAKDEVKPTIEDSVAYRVPSPVGVNGNSSEEVLDDSRGSLTEESYADVRPMKEIGEIKYIGARNAVLFNLEDILECQKEDLPDEFFELTVNDVRYLFGEQKRIRSELENQPLLLKNQRDSAAYLSRLSRYKQTVIRIYFPDQLVLQGTFIVDETVQSVVEFVRKYLENPDLNFYLYITPPKTTLNLNATLLEAKLVPAAVVYFGCDTQCPCYLPDDIRNQISDPRAATRAAREIRKKAVSGDTLSQLTSTLVLDDKSLEPSSPDLAPSTPAVAPPSPPRNISHVTNADGQQSKVPAWFKLGNK